MQVDEWMGKDSGTRAKDLAEGGENCVRVNDRIGQRCNRELLVD